MEEFIAEESARKRNFTDALNRMERVYLAALRALALIVATLLLIYALWLGATGLYQASQDVNSVKEAPATVTTEEITAIDLKSTKEGQPNADADPLRIERAFYQNFAKRYRGLYRSKFETFKQKDDQRVGDREFDAAYVRMSDRLDAIKQGTLNFESDKTDLEALVKGMTEAADAKVTHDRLAAYRSAKKTSITRTVTDTKTERYCSYYGYYIGSCISWDTREVPVKRTVVETRLPDGIVTPADLFAAYHAKFVSTLVERRTENAAKAQDTRKEILQANEEGAASLWTAIRVVGAFILLMFLFLLIALERHQRRLAQATHAING